MQVPGSLRRRVLGHYAGPHRRCGAFFDEAAVLRELPAPLRREVLRTGGASRAISSGNRCLAIAAGLSLVNSMMPLRLRPALGWDLAAARSRRRGRWRCCLGRGRESTPPTCVRMVMSVHSDWSYQDTCDAWDTIYIYIYIYIYYVFMIGRIKIRLMPGT